VTVVACPLCGAEHQDGIRCPECNVDPGFGPQRPTPFGATVLWAMMGAIAAVFVVTLVLVAVT